MFLEGRQWQLGFGAEQMKSVTDVRDRQVRVMQGPGGGWSTLTPRKDRVAAALEQD